MNKIGFTVYGREWVAEISDNEVALIDPSRDYRHVVQHGPEVTRREQLEFVAAAFHNMLNGFPISTEGNRPGRVYRV